MKRFTILCMLLATVALGSCVKVVAPAPTGNLHGTVALATPLRSDRILDASGVKVEIEGTSYSTLSVNSNSSTGIAEWTIKDLPAGTYTIKYSKPGFGEIREFGIQHTGNGDAYRDRMYTLHEIPTNFKVTNLRATRFDTTMNENTANSYDWTTIRMTATVDRLPYETGNNYKYSSAMVYFGKTNQVSSDPRTYLYCETLIGYTTSTADREIQMAGGQLHKAGFAPGDTAYLVAYAMGKDDGASSYYDPTLQKYIVTSISPIPSNVTSIVIP